MIELYRFAMSVTCTLVLALCSCFCQSQESTQQRLNLVSSRAINKSRQDKKDDKWTKIEVPLGKAADVIAFGGNGNVAIAGTRVLLLSVDNGQTWQTVTKGEGSSMYTTDGGVTYRNDLNNPEASKSSIDINNLCGVESAVFTCSGRLYLYDICEHSTSLWSIPTRSPSGKWYIRGFAPTPEQHERRDNPDYYTPYGNFIVVGKRIVIDAVLPTGTALLTTDNDGAKWYPPYRCIKSLTWVFQAACSASR